MALRAFGNYFINLTGRSRLLVAWSCGALASLALPPLYLAPALVPAFSIFALLFDRLDRKWTAFAIGWWFGFGYFVLSLYWVGFSLLVEADKYAWLLPFSTLGLPAVLAVFTGLGSWLTFIVCRRLGLDGFARVLVLALCWTLFEWMRSFVFTGFPWNLPGYAWGVSGTLMQLASVVGVHALGLLGIIIAASPAALFDEGNGRKKWLPVAGSVLFLLVVSGWGYNRLASNPTTLVDDVRVRIVQPAIDQKDKWRPEMRRSNLDKYLRLSSAEGAENISLLVWPETAIPYFLDRQPALRRALGEILSPGALLLTGIPRVPPQPRAEGEAFRLWNSVQALNERGEIVAGYDKHHLVPFGEYVPLRPVLGLLGIERLADGRGDFQRGSGPATLALPGYPAVSPLICYEVIFPGEVVDRQNRPGWLLNVTNDAWFGISAGPHQHFAISRMRAVEEGLPLMRAANSGISAIVDPLGRLTGRLALGTSGFLDGALPTALPEPGFFARFGNAMVFVPVFLVLLLIGLFRRN